MTGLRIFATALMMLTTACGSMTTLVSGTEASEAEAEVCRSLGEALPTRSRQDTTQTQGEIQRAYAVFEAACPDHKDLIP